MSRADVLTAAQQLRLELGRNATEREIAARARRARSTVHYHLRRLAADGIVALTPTAGRYVLQPDADTARNRTCDPCGTSLEGRRRQARHCSGACRAEASRRRRMLAYQEGGEP